MLRNILRIKQVSNFRLQTLSQLRSAPNCNRTLVTNSPNFALSVAEDAEEEKKKKSNPFATASPKLKEPLPEAREPVVNMNDEETAKRLKVLQLEVDIQHQEGRRVPQLSFFKDHHWQNVLALPSKSARIKYYAYLWQIETKKELKERKKELKAEEVLARKEQQRKEVEENEHIVYGLGHTSMFLRIYDTTINHWQNNRLCQAMRFSPKMVLDCSYDRYMTKQEAVNAGKQLMLCFAENRAHDDPFDLHYCNVNLKSVCMQTLKRFIPTMHNPDFPMNVHEQCFTELFPKEQLVYLTPHCRNDLVEYNPDDIYIVGAMVDKVNNEPLSLAKAKKLGLRMARLPLDRYLQWGSGSGKSLALNQMIHIMCDLKSTGDWERSLVHVPRRKIIDLEREPQRDRRQLNERSGKLNLRMSHILSDDLDEDSNPSQTVRSHKEKLQFNLDTWGSKKKRNNFK